MQLGGLIVGLGNPGAEYRNTRHNFGFMVLEALLEAASGPSGPAGVQLLSGKKDAHHLWRASFGPGAQWLLAEPLTYMNRSGEAVQRIAAYYKLEPEQLLVLHDELDLPLGRIKLKKGGGSAGHNGIRSIEQMLGSADFYRLRLGVGKPRGQNGASWVLGRFFESERQDLEKTVKAAMEGVLVFTRESPRKAQQFCNGFSLEPPPPPAPAPDAAALAARAANGGLKKNRQANTPEHSGAHGPDAGNGHPMHTNAVNAANAAADKDQP